MKMPDTINGKTPEEIKKDAETCLNHPSHTACNYCNLFSECGGIAEHIIKELYDLVLQLESRLAQTERGRDELFIYLPHDCTTCRFELTCERSDECNLGELWEWRGVVPENTKEEK